MLYLYVLFIFGDNPSLQPALTKICINHCSKRRYDDSISMYFAFIPRPNYSDSIIHNKDSLTVFVLMAIKGTLEEMVSNPSNLIVSVVFEAHLGVRFGLLSVLGRYFG